MMPTACGPAPMPIIVVIKRKTAEAIARMVGGTRSCAVANAGPIQMVLEKLAGRYINNAHRVFSNNSAAEIVGMGKVKTMSHMYIRGRGCRRDQRSALQPT